MINNMIASAIDNMFDFFYTAFQGLNFDIIFWIGVGLILVFSLVSIVRMVLCYESKTIRGINKINRYLLQHPSITEENLVTFHNYMKKMPQRFRDRWQLFVLEREGLPSRYLTTEFCVKRPLVNSVLISVGKQITLSSLVLATFTFILGLGYALANAAGTVSISNIIDVMIYAFGTPAIVLLIGGIMRMIIQLRISSVSMKLYDMFNVFVRNINKAVATMPDSVDYEVLFTQKEINEGIPILREYLEKKALEEQQLLEASKYDAVSHSPYDFKDLGVDGEQLISRAVEESEKFLMKKIGLQNEISDYEKKLTQSEGNMDDIEKEANRKLQAIKENLERLDKAIAETTNRVEINYNRRQIKDEIEKRALIEKDLKSLLSKEQVIVNECKAEIQKRKDLIEKEKAQVEVSLKSEYDTFAVKVYDTLNDKVSEDSVDTMKDYQAQIVDLKTKIQNLTREVENRDALIAQKDVEIGNIYNSNEKAVKMLKGKKVNENDNAQQPNNEDNTPRPNLMTGENVQQNLGQYYDENGNLIDYSQYYDENGNLIDYSQYYDENGNLIDYSKYYDENGNLIDYSKYYDENGNYIGPTQEEWNKKEQQEQKQAQEVQQKQSEPESQTDENDEESQEFEEGTPEEEQIENVEQAIEQEVVETKPKQKVQSKNKKSAKKKSVKNIKTKKTAKTIKPKKSVKKSAKSKKKSGGEGMTAKPVKTVDKKITQAGKDVKPVAPSLREIATVDKVKVETPSKSIGFKILTKNIPQNAESSNNAVEEIQTPSKLKIGKPASAETITKTAEPKVEKLTTVKKAKPVEKKKVKPIEKKVKKSKSKPIAKKKTIKVAEQVVKELEKQPAKKEYDFNEIQEQIDKENAKLQQQQNELREQINQALVKMEKSKTYKKGANIQEIKKLIEQLKEQAKLARANGGTPEQIRSINASVGELVDAITKYSGKK